MAKVQYEQFFYIAKVEFLGFRYHGWQKQKDRPKTVQGMLEKTLNFVLECEHSKLLSASRTDAMVSANDFLCKFKTRKYMEPQKLLFELNKNLPLDIKIHSVKETQKSFNIIDAPKTKTYHYYFCNEFKPSPMIAPFMVNFNDQLDIELMKKAAKIFEGEHSFERYCYRPNENKIFKRVIDSCSIFENDILTANFFPEQSYVFEVVGKGFLRHQVRIMMGAMILVGSGQMSLEEFKQTLEGQSFERVKLIAPASGLKLFKSEFTYE
ncbi:MAG: tRNA pseudouridine(38-40) synthase TruA [Bacteriovoracaceae bacterium]|nr:tRNA pseudouridine(38-40) synthase TruA [Bacteriovoracaceae bacterium]